MEDAKRVSRPARALLWLGVLVLAWGLAIVLAGPVYEGLSALGWKRDYGYGKVLRRLLLVPPVVLFFVALRPWRDGSLASYGLRGPRARWGPALLGAACSLATCGLLLWLQVAIEAVHAEPEIRPGEAAWRATKYMATGLVVATLENWLFRGWMQRRTEALMPVLPAALLVSAVFGVLHAFKPSALEVEVSHDPAGAFEAIGAWLSHLADPEAFGPSFFGLFLLGLLLTAAYLRTRTLWTCVGIHAAGIWFLSSYGAFTERSVGRTWAGSKVLYDGWPAWALLAATTLLLWPRRRAEDVRSEG